MPERKLSDSGAALYLLLHSDANSQIERGWSRG